MALSDLNVEVCQRKFREVRDVIGKDEKMFLFLCFKTLTALFRILSSLIVQLSCNPNLRVSHFTDMPLPECECVNKLYRCWYGLWCFIHACLVRALRMKGTTAEETVVWRRCIGPNAFFLPSFLPSFLPFFFLSFFLSFFLPSFLSLFLSFFLSFVLPFFLSPSFLSFSFLSFFLPSFLPFFLSSFLLFFLSSFLFLSISFPDLLILTLFLFHFMLFCSSLSFLLHRVSIIYSLRIFFLFCFNFLFSFRFLFSLLYCDMTPESRNMTIC
jgi:hypothetical protein